MIPEAISSSLPPRPRWNAAAVRQDAAAAVLHRVLDWVREQGGKVPETDDVERHVRAALSLALVDGVDAYGAARFLDTVAGWPVNAALMTILNDAYAAMPTLALPRVHAWVMQHSFRFPAKRDERIRFRHGDGEVNGTVIEVIGREARAIVRCRIDNTAASDRLMSVDAEDVTLVRPARRKTDTAPETDPA